MADPIRLAPASCPGASAAAPQSDRKFVSAPQNFTRTRNGAAFKVSLVPLNLPRESDCLVMGVPVPPAAPPLADNHLTPRRLPPLG